jgi:hypothetical protein
LSAGKTPPKPPPTSQIGLTEVERAMSVLDGHHPEHEQSARQTREAAAARRGQIEEEPLGAQPGPPDARVTALATAAVDGPDHALVPLPESVALACDPPFGPGTRETICVPSTPISWFNRKDVPAGAARAGLPVWLGPLESRREIDALARILELLALTRRLSREGFEATALEGVTELPEGVRVIGRAGEDAVVAVGLAPKPPWALPYSDSVPWDLGDAPRVVPLQPGQSVKLTPATPPSAPLRARRTVVFRRSSLSP